MKKADFSSCFNENGLCVTKPNFMSMRWRADELTKEIPKIMPTKAPKNDKKIGGLHRWYK